MYVVRVLIHVAKDSELPYARQMQVGIFTLKRPSSWVTKMMKDLELDLVLWPRALDFQIH